MSAPAVIPDSEMVHSFFRFMDMTLVEFERHVAAEFKLANRSQALARLTWCEVQWNFINKDIAITTDAEWATVLGATRGVSTPTKISIETMSSAEARWLQELLAPPDREMGTKRASGRTATHRFDNLSIT